MPRLTAIERERAVGMVQQGATLRRRRQKVGLRTHHYHQVDAAVTSDHE